MNYIHITKKSLRSWIMKPRKKSPQLRGTLVRLSGSFTVEAAIVIPLISMVFVFIFFMSRIMIIEWGISCSMDQAVRQVALLGNHADDLGIETVELYMDAEVLKNQVPTKYITNGILGIDYSASTFTESEITLVAQYHVKVPFTLFSNLQWEITQQSISHRWVGYDPETDGDTIQYVYVTETGEAYHLDRECTYLNPSIRSISRTELESERSLLGGKYAICPLCGDHGESVLYVTNWGNSYHTSISCSALKRTIRMIPYEEAIETYHACSKCGGE